jgi:hypothetical protein
LPPACEQQREIVRETDVGAHERAPRVVAAVLELGADTAIALRLACHDVDRAADVVLAEQRALRTAQHFDAFRLGEVEIRAERAGEIDAVDVETDGRVRRQQEVELADAADERTDLRRGAAGARREIEVRNRALERRHAIVGVLREVVARQRADRNRRRLDVRLDALRRDR